MEHLIFLVLFGFRITNGGRKWYEEFKRFCYHVPAIGTDISSQEGVQVLHVSFSHHGKYFATCSTDGYVKLWTSEYPCEVKYSKNMKELEWNHAQYSQFDQSDELLVVSPGKCHSFSYHGSDVIAFFNLGNRFECQIIDEPKILSQWYNYQCLLSGSLDRSMSISSLTTTEEVGSVPISHVMFNSCNRNGLRIALMARCKLQSNNEIGRKELGGSQDRLAEHEHPIKLSDSRWLPNDVRVVVPEFSFVTVGEERLWLSSDSPYVERFNSWCENGEVGEMDQAHCRTESDGFVSTHGYLIFTITRDDPNSPHQIAFKWIKLQDEKEHGTWDIDGYDDLIDVGYMIVGMALSPDHRNLYVSYRLPSQSYEMLVIPLQSMRTRKMVVPLGNGFLSNSVGFLDVGNDYVARWTDGNPVNLYDRHFGVCLADYEHNEIVAFNPKDAEMLVTTSNGTIRIWRSRAKVEELDMRPIREVTLEPISESISALSL